MKRAVYCVFAVFFIVEAAILGWQLLSAGGFDRAGLGAACGYIALANIYMDMAGKRSA